MSWTACVRWWMTCQSVRKQPRRKSDAPGEAQAEPPAETPLGPVSVCIVPARDEADEIVGTMLLRRLTARRVAAELLTTDVLKSEVVEHVAELAPQAVYVSALPPAAVLHASFLLQAVTPAISGSEDRRGALACRRRA